MTVILKLFIVIFLSLCQYKYSILRIKVFLLFCIYPLKMFLSCGLYLNIFLNVSLSFVVDYFNYKHINHLVTVQCQDVVTLINAQKLLSGYNFFSNNRQNNFDSNIPFKNNKIGMFLNASCDDWDKIFVNTSINIFKSPFVWLILTQDLSSTTNTLANYPIEINSDVTIAVKANNQHVSFFELYHTGFFTHGSLVVNLIGFWDTKLHVSDSFRKNLTGVVIKTTVVVTDRIEGETFENYLGQPRQDRVDSLHKLKFFTLLIYLRDMYNFSAKQGSWVQLVINNSRVPHHCSNISDLMPTMASFVLQRTNSWGYLRNGSFDGMVGVLQRMEADIGGSPVFVRADRAKIVDYTVQTWQSRPCFVLRHPKHPGGFYSIYTRPLTATVWCTILALLVVFGFILSVIIRLEFLKTGDDEMDSSSSLALLVIWSAVCQQGMSLQRSSTSVKLVIFVTFVFMLTIYQYYNATVVSTLLREPPKNIRTLEDLLKSNLKAGVEDVLYNKDFFRRTTDPVALEFYNKKLATGSQVIYFRPNEGMAKVKSGGFAFHVDSAIAYRIMRQTFSEREICEAHEISLYPPQNMAAVVQKGSPYKEMVAYGIRRMYEAGLLHRLKSVWDEAKPACVRTPDTSVFSVSIREFSMVLILLCVGMMAAVVILFCELLVYEIDNRKRITGSHYFQNKKLCFVKK